MPQKIDDENGRWVTVSPKPQSKKVDDEGGRWVTVSATGDKEEEKGERGGIFTAANAVRFGGSMLGDLATPFTFGAGPFIGGALGELGGQMLEGAPIDLTMAALEGGLNYIPGAGKLERTGLKELGKYVGRATGHGVAQGVLGTFPRHQAAQGNLWSPSEWEMPSVGEFAEQGAAGGIVGGVVGGTVGGYKNYRGIKPTPPGLNALGEQFNQRMPLRQDVFGPAEDFNRKQGQLPFNAVDMPPPPDDIGGGPLDPPDTGPRGQLELDLGDGPEDYEYAPGKFERMPKTAILQDPTPLNIANARRRGYVPSEELPDGTLRLIRKDLAPAQESELPQDKSQLSRIGQIQRERRITWTEAKRIADEEMGDQTPDLASSIIERLKQQQQQQPSGIGPRPEPQDPNDPPYGFEDPPPPEEQIGRDTETDPLPENEDGLGDSVEMTHENIARQPYLLSRGFAISRGERSPSGKSIWRRVGSPVPQLRSAVPQATTGNPTGETVLHGDTPPGFIEPNAEGDWELKPGGVLPQSALKGMKRAGIILKEIRKDGTKVFTRAVKDSEGTDYGNVIMLENLRKLFNKYADLIQGRTPPLPIETGKVAEFYEPRTINDIIVKLGATLRNNVDDDVDVDKLMTKAEWMIDSTKDPKDIKNNLDDLTAAFKVVQDSGDDDAIEFVGSLRDTALNKYRQVFQETPFGEIRPLSELRENFISSDEPEILGGSRTMADEAMEAAQMMEDKGDIEGARQQRETVRRMLAEEGIQRGDEIAPTTPPSRQTWFGEGDTIDADFTRIPPMGQQSLPIPLALRQQSQLENISNARASEPEVDLGPDPRQQSLFDPNDPNKGPDIPRGPDVAAPSKERQSLMKKFFLDDQGAIPLTDYFKGHVEIWNMFKKALNAVAPNGMPSLLKDAWNSPSSFTTTGDASPGLRQAITHILTPQFWKAVPAAWKAARHGREAHDFIEAQLRKNKIFKEPLNPVTGLPEESRASVMGIKIRVLPDKPGPKAEGVVSRWIENGGFFGPEMINGHTNPVRYAYAKSLGRYFAATNRGFVTLLNHITVHRAERLLDLARDSAIHAYDTGQGRSRGVMGGSDRFLPQFGKRQAYTQEEAISMNPYQNDELAKQIGNFVNTASGQGSLGRFEGFASELASILFAPRLLASRLQMLNPMTYVRADPFVRKQYLQSLLSTSAAWGSIAAITSAYGLATGNDVSVGTNPISSDFMKVRIGNTRIDPGGGFLQFMTGFARMMQGGYRSSSTNEYHRYGEGYQATTQFEQILRFGTNKLNPMAKLVADLMMASEHVPVHMADRSIQLVVPLIGQDLIELLSERPDLFPLIVPMYFGAGSQTYDKGESIAKFIDKENDWIVEGGGVRDLIPFIEGSKSNSW